MPDSRVRFVGPLRRLVAPRLRRWRTRGDAEQIFDLSPDILVVATFDGHFRWVNPAGERTLGHPREELLSRPFMDFVHPDDRERTTARMAQLTIGLPVTQFENRYIRSDGSVCWIEWTTRPVVPRRLVYGVGRDITARRRHEERLREAQRQVEVTADELRALADEQAALRRVATLVARGLPPAALFDAVTVETTRILRADASGLFRYEDDAGMTLMAQDPGSTVVLAVGDRIALDGDSAAARVLRTGRPARMESYDDAVGAVGDLQRAGGYRAAIGAPIVVESRLWGVMITTWSDGRVLAADAENRLAEFTELIGMAIANAETRAELTASRARVVLAADEARRRIERNLHDGTQQRLVSVVLHAREAQAMVGPEQHALASVLERIVGALGEAAEELQEISRGLHPAILSTGGLVAALKALARRSPVPVELSVDLPIPVPQMLEAPAFYSASEAVTNAVKHAGASVVGVELKTDAAEVMLTVRDDGVGGADPAHGSGLVGLRDRVEALDGTLELSSPRGQGTTLTIRMPLRVASDAVDLEAMARRAADSPRAGGRAVE